jgi:hypothetical protein
LPVELPNEAFFAAFPEVFGAMLSEALTKSNYQMNSVYKLQPNYIQA